MGKSQGENGFMLFARDLRVRHSEQGLPTADIPFVRFLTDIASETWTALGEPAKQDWKQKARDSKHQRSYERPSVPSRSKAPADVADAWDSVLDECELLERLPRKRGQDVERLADKWLWRYGDDHPPAKTLFWLISVQEFGQGVGGLDRRPEHLPAEISLVGFSLKDGVRHHAHHIAHHFPREELAEGEDVEYSVSRVHGIRPFSEEHIPTMAKDSLLNFAHNLEKARRSGKMGDRFYCYESEFLSVVGCLNFLSRATGLESLSAVRWDAELLCVEDFVDVCLGWHSVEDLARLKAALDVGDAVRGLRSRLQPLLGQRWDPLLCRLHGLLAKPDDDAPLQQYWRELGVRPPSRAVDESKCPPPALGCSEALLRGTVALLRSWVHKESTDGPMPSLEDLAKASSGPQLPKETARLAQPLHFHPDHSISEMDLAYALLRNGNNMRGEVNETNSVTSTLAAGRGRGRGRSSLVKTAQKVPGSFQFRKDQKGSTSAVACASERPPSETTTTGGSLSRFTQTPTRRRSSTPKDSDSDDCLLLSPDLDTTQQPSSSCAQLDVSLTEVSTVSSGIEIITGPSREPFSSDEDEGVILGIGRGRRTQLPAARNGKKPGQQ